MIEVLATPPLNTVQDLGRLGYRRLGVGSAGAMDPLALQLGNAMLGNAVGDAGLELQMFPVRLRMTADSDVALTGANGNATLDGHPVLPYWAMRVREGQVLEIGQPRRGARAYLCLAGGIDVPLLMGSRSTALRSGFGGHDGRAVRRGDVLRAGTLRVDGRVPPNGFGIVPPEFAPRDRVTPAGAQDGADAVAPIVIRAIPAGEYDEFEPVQQQVFWSSSWKISLQSDRTGYRFSGPSLQTRSAIEMRSYGVVAGLVQVPPGGQPIVQLSDANTAGGYPKIVTVIDADLWRLGQAPAGACVRFVECSYHDAREALLGQARHVRDVGRNAAWARGCLDDEKWYADEA